MPLWDAIFRRTLSACLLDGMSFAPLPQRQQIPRFGAVVVCHFPPHPFSMPSGRHCRSPLYRNGSRFRDSVPLWSAIFHRILSACLLDGIVVRPFAATAAKPVIRCRCGASFSLRSFPRWKVPVEMAFCHHLPGVGSVPDGLWVRCASFVGGEFGGWATGCGGHGGVAGNEFGGCGGEPAVLVECFA